MAVIGNAPFQGLVSGGNIIDASIEGVDLSTSAIAARLGYTPVDPGAATFTANVTINDDSANAALRITQTGAGNALLVEDSTNPDATPFVIDASGNVIVGGTTPITGAQSYIPPLQVSTGNTNNSGVGVNAFSAGSGSGYLHFNRSKSSTVGTNTLVTSGDTIGNIVFAGADGTGFIRAAIIQSIVDGTPGTNDMPGRLVFSTTADGASSPTERMRISSTGQTTFSYNAIISVTDNTNAALRITQLGTGNALLVEDSANPDSTPFVIDASGNTVVGSTAPIATVSFAGGAITPLFQVQGTGLNSSSAGVSNWSGTAASASSFVFSKSNSGTIGTRGAVASATNLGSVNFAGDDGTNFVPAASILAVVDGTPGMWDMPGRLVFNTTADGDSVPTERMRINSVGNVGIGTSTNTLYARLHVLGSTGAILESYASGRSAPGAGLMIVDGGYGSTTGVASLALSGGLGNNGTMTGWVISSKNTGGAGAPAPYLAFSALTPTTGGSSTQTAISTEYARFNEGGLFGIGTSSPQAKLHVFQRSDAGAAPSTPEIRIEHQDINAVGTGGSNGGILSFVNIQRDNTGWAADKIWGRINFYPSQPTSGTAQLGASILAAADGAISGQQSSTYLAFYTSDGSNGGNNVERVRINNAGSVGIGTISPGALLHVQNSGSNGGTIQIGSTAIDSGTSTVNMYGADNYIQASHRNVSSPVARINLLPAALGTNSSGAIAFSTRDSAGTLNERFRFQSDGTGYWFPNSDGGGSNVYQLGKAIASFYMGDGNGTVTASIKMARFGGTGGGITSGAGWVISTGLNTYTPYGWYNDEPTVKISGYAFELIRGNLFSINSYSSTVGATNRDLYIDNTGCIGYVSSTRESKTNITSQSDVSWLLALEPVQFNRRKKEKINKHDAPTVEEYSDDYYEEVEYGLIAEDVESINKNLCFYDVEDDQKVLRGVHYSKLATPLLKLVQLQNKAIQEQQAIIQQLTARLDAANL